MTSINSMSLGWDFKEQLTEIDLQGGGKAFYVYDSNGQRVRKVIERIGGLTEERIYLSNYETFRKRQGAALQLERETLHVSDDKQPIALVERRTLDTLNVDPAPPLLTRHQISNHLGSSALEVDDGARVISYEEYHVHGTTAFQAVRSQTETPKRYRYTGKERDEETGFTYHQARYYLPWLGRWCQSDPGGPARGLNSYSYVSGRPIIRSDKDGCQEGQLWLMQQRQLTVSPVATRGSRGITDLQRAALRGLDYGFGPGEGAHWGHPTGQSFVVQPAGTRVTLSAEPWWENVGKSHLSKLEKAAAKDAGTFFRVDDIDPTVAPGTRFKQPAPEAFEAPFARYDAAVKTGEPVRFLAPDEAYQVTIAFPETPTPVADSGQVSFAFDKPPSPATPPSPPVDAAPPKLPAPTQAAKPTTPTTTTPKPNTPSGGSKALKALGQGAEGAALVVGLGIEGQDEGSSAEALLMMAAGGAVVKLGVRAIAAQPELAVAAAVGVAIGVGVEAVAPGYSQHAADMGVRAEKYTGSKAAGVGTTIVTTLPLVWVGTKLYDFATK